MALPLDNRQINNVIATTIDAKRPRLIDNFFTSNPLFVRLHTREAIHQDGGDKIRTSFIYGGLPGGSYGKGDPFGTAFTEFMTDLLLDWKRNRAELALDNLDAAKNMGAARIIDLTDAMMQAGRMTLADKIGTQLFGDGTGNNSKDIDGLRVAVDDTLAYGGITRDTSAQGTAVKANINTTGGPFSLAMVNTSMGTATIGGEQPDLLVTGQTIWNKFWERSQPSERNVAEDFRKIGMKSVQFNGADVVVDSHVPGGVLYGLNTKFVEFWIMTGNDFRTRGPFDLHTQDAWVGQIILYANLAVTSPRLQFRIDNIT